MKIVDEIVLEVGRGRQWVSGTVHANELESIIAAKLEPVRAFLREGEWSKGDFIYGAGTGCLKCGGNVKSRGHRKGCAYAAVLALFEEE